MSDSTPVDLTAIKARLAEATPGPWATYDDGNMEVYPSAEANGEYLYDWYVSCGSARFADAELIAHAPTDLAALIAEVERLRAERDAMTTEWGVRDDSSGKITDKMKTRAEAEGWAMVGETVVSRRVSAWVVDGEQP